MIVGAGPVGLLAAIELKSGGVDFMVLERLSAPTLDHRALWLGPLGAETLERRGSRDNRIDKRAFAFSCVKPLSADSGPSMLIRPDGCVAWAGGVEELDGLGRALDRWFAPSRRDMDPI